jgi:hypothetical protein
MTASNIVTSSLSGDANLFRSVRPRAHPGNWQPQRNRDFRELLSAGVGLMLVNGAVQIEETATQLAESLKLNFQATEHASLRTNALPCGFLESAVL